MEITRPEIGVAIRTLLAAGFNITGTDRHPSGLEIACTRHDVLGLPIDYRIVLVDGEAPNHEETVHLAKATAEENRRLVVIASAEGPDWLSWHEFLAALGGAVPNWRALAPGFEETYLTLARNESPLDTAVEAWSAFEDATADAFEFLLGVRVNRLGGKKRGKKVSDLVTHIPDPKVLVIDTKAYKDPFDASSGALRALQEYTVRQRHRQGNGGIPLGGAVVVANDFKQNAAAIATIAADFIAATGVPVTFIRARTLVAIVAAVANDSTLRRAIRWSHLLCRSGVLEDTLARTEIDDARDERRGT